MCSSRVLRAYPTRTLLAAAVLLFWAGAAPPAAARTVNVGAAIQREGESQQPLPRDADVRVRDAKTGKLVGKGTIKKRSGGLPPKPAAIELPPGEYDVEVHTSEGDLSDPRAPKTTHYGDTRRIRVTKPKGSEGVDLVVKPLSKNEVIEHRMRKVDDDIQGLEERIAINERLRDAKKKVDEDAAQEHQERIDELEKEIGKHKRSKKGYQKQLDELGVGKGGKKPGDRAPGATQGAPTRVQPDPNVRGPEGVRIPTHQTPGGEGWGRH